MKKGHCFYFTGYQNIICKKNINYRNLVGGDDFGWAVRLPCFKEKNSSIVCEKYRDPTEEELRKCQESWDKKIEEMMTVLPLVEKLKKENKKGGSGVEECPVCKKPISWQISGYNNHIHMNCITENCINFIE